jgi:hypothetical protein
VNQYEKYKETYKLLKTLPLYQKLKKKNNKLKTEIEKLKSDNKKLLDIICSFPSFSFGNNPKSKKLKPLRNYVKKESEDQDDVCILEPPETPNIIVNIIDDESFLENKKNTQYSSHEDTEGDVEDAEEEEAEEEEVEDEGEAQGEDEVEEEGEAEEEVEEAEQEVEEAEQEVEDAEEEVEDAEEEVEDAEEEVEDAEEEVEEAEEEEESEEVQSVMINNKEYYTTNPTNGVIYDVDENGEINNEVGSFKNGVAKFY